MTVSAPAAADSVTLHIPRRSLNYLYHRVNNLEQALRRLLLVAPPFDRCRNEGARQLWWSSPDYAAALRFAWETVEEAPAPPRPRPRPQPRPIPRVQYGLGRVLQRRRLALDLTIKEAARRARVDRKDWSKWERSDITTIRPFTLNKIATALVTTLEDLIAQPSA